MIYTIQPCMFLIYVHYNSEIMGRLKMDIFIESPISNVRHDYNKTDDLSPTTRKLTGHNSRKTHSPPSLRLPYPPIYTLPT